MKISKAYSLVELSIVILIIGVLVGGITEGTKLLKKSKLKTARALTSSSYAASVEDMVFWLDATAEGSLTNGSDSVKVQDGDRVKSWTDINPQVRTKIRFDNVTEPNAYPYYVSNGISGLPTVFFDGSADTSTGNDLYTAASQFTNTSTFTVFIVLRPMQVTSSFSYILFGFGGGSTGFAFLKQNSPAAFQFVGKQTASQVTSDESQALSHTISYVSTLIADGTNQIIYRNGVSMDSDPSVIVPNDGTTSFRISCTNVNGVSNCFDGYISEIILYSRALETRERKAIERYLGQKYGIKVS